MFGMLVEEGSESGWGRLARRRVVGLGHYGEDWGPAITASINFTATAVDAIVKGTRKNTQQDTPTTYQCPQGMVWDSYSAQCMPLQNQGGGLDLGNVSPLLIGGGLLLAVLLLGRS